MAFTPSPANAATLTEGDSSFTADGGRWTRDKGRIFSKSISETTRRQQHYSILLPRPARKWLIFTFTYTPYANVGNYLTLFHGKPPQHINYEAELTSGQRTVEWGDDGYQGTNPSSGHHADKTKGYSFHSNDNNAHQPKTYIPLFGEVRFQSVNSYRETAAYSRFRFLSGSNAPMVAFMGLRINRSLHDITAVGVHTNATTWNNTLVVRGE